MKLAVSGRPTEKNLTLFLFLALPTALLLLMAVYPLLRLVWLSFTDWNGLSPDYAWAGLDNYREVLASPTVWRGLRNNSLYFVIHLVLIPVEILIAYILDLGLRGSTFFKKLFFMPYIINGVAVAYMFTAILSPIEANGALATFLSWIGRPDLIAGWLSDPEIVNYSLVFVSLWRFTGFHIVLFLAAMQSLSPELFDAADLDGATLLQKFRYIVVPGIWLVIQIVLFLNVRGALQVFDIPFVMTSGGPGHASSTFSVYVIETAFKFSSVGKAASMAVVLFLLILVLAQVQRLVFRFRKAS